MTVVTGGAAGPDEPFGWVRDVPLHGRFDPNDGRFDPYEGVGGAGDGGGGDEGPGGCRFGDGAAGGDPFAGWADAGEEPPEPQWAVDASAQELRERLAAAVRAPAGIDAAEVIEQVSAAVPGAPPAAAPFCGVDAAVVDAAGLVDGIRVVARLVNHYQAVQQQWIAALARPGVGVPLVQLVDACRHPGRAIPGALRPPGELPEGLPPGSGGDPDLRPLLAHPAWRAPLADTAARLAAAEVGCALHLAPATARGRVEKALAVIDELPATFAAQYAGDLDGYRAAIITDRTDVLPGDQRARVERRVLPGAWSRTPGVLRDQVDRAVIAADPQAAARRAGRARAGRGVRLDRARDDMAEFRALIGCTDGQLAFGVLDEQAAALAAAGLAAGRGASQLRADVFCDLFRTLAQTGHAHLTGTRPEAQPNSGTGPGTADRTENHGATGRAATESSPGATGQAEDHGGTGGTTTDAHSRTTGPAADQCTTGGADTDSGHGTTGGADTDSSPGIGGGATTGTGHGTAGRTDGHDTGCDAAGCDGAGDRFTGVQPCHGRCTDTPGGHGRGGPAGTVAGRRRGTALTVYLDAATLAGLDDRAGELAGYGTITAPTARALAASADTIRAVITRPATHDLHTHDPDPPGPGAAPSSGHTDNPARSRTCGTILDAGRAVYRPPDPLLDYVTARDRTCCWPGCRAPAQRCDTDHRRAFNDGGATCACNLDLLCRTHHRVKTFTAWRAEPGPDGVLVWTSPTGHRYPSEPGHGLLDPAGDIGPPDTTTTIADPDPPPF